MRNKRGGIADLVSLFFATVMIAIILVGFFAVSMVVKNLEKAETSERLLEGREIGLDDVIRSMVHHGRLVDAQKLIKEGGSVDESLIAVGYGVYVYEESEEISQKRWVNVAG